MERRSPLSRACVAALLVVSLAACESLPGSRTQQSTAIGAAAGAAVGAAVAGEGNRIGGALLGAAVGAAGGYLIGARTSWFKDPDARGEALDAIAAARRDPATPTEAQRAETADLDSNGFVTLDELVAMEDAGLNDSEMLARLRRTEQVFDVNAAQRAALTDAGVSPAVVSGMERINAAEKRRVLGAG